MLDFSESRDRLAFIGRRLPPWALLRVFVIAAGAERVFEPSEWRDSLVVIERGQLELQSLDGLCWRRACGDVMFLAGLPLRMLRNDGCETALVSAVSRACTDAAPQRGVSVI